MTMKTIISNMALITCLTLSQLAPLNVQADIGPGGGNGGDNVEPLFINAKKETVSLLNEITTADVDSLNIDEPYKNWLKTASNLSHLQFYANAMKLSFQDRPCNEKKQPRSTSYSSSKNGDSVMCISYSYNRATTSEQAIALVIHEAGHFVGEKDHIFLSSLGAQLSSQNANKEETFKDEYYNAFIYRDALLAKCISKYKTCFYVQDSRDSVIIMGTNRYISNSSLVICKISDRSFLANRPEFVVSFINTKEGIASETPIVAGKTLDEALVTANKYKRQNICGHISIQ